MLTLYFSVFQIQIVMKKGLVEIPTTGSVSDFDDAILINRTEVENINAVILVSKLHVILIIFDKNDFIFKGSEHYLKNDVHMLMKLFK